MRAVKVEHPHLLVRAAEAIIARFYDRGRKPGHLRGVRSVWRFL